MLNQFKGGWGGRPLTIAEVLIEGGHPLGRRGRTTCPIHGGDNRQAFKFTETGYVCFACGAHGNAYQLRVALGLLPPPRPRPRAMRGVDPAVFARPVLPPRDTRPPPSRRLAALLEEARVVRLKVWGALHARAVRQLAAAEAILAWPVGDRHLGHAEPGLKNELFDVAAALAADALGWRDQADAHLGCDCRGPVDLDQLAAIR